MIIGNNSNNTNSNNGNVFNPHFNKKLNYIKEQAKNNQSQMNSFNPEQRQYDVTNRNDMADKSIAMLQERLSKGLISLDEFNRKAKKINQSRQ